MNTWKVILATLVIFGTGVVTGGLLVTHNDRVKRRQIWMMEQSEKNRQPRPGGREPGTPVQRAGSNHVTEPPVRQQGLLPSMLRNDLLMRIENRIQLTPGQREKIQDILREGQETTSRIMEPVQGELQNQVRATRNRIREVLTTEQQPRFDELMSPQRRGEEPSPADRRLQRQQQRPQDGPPRFPGPRPGEPSSPQP